MVSDPQKLKPLTWTPDSVDAFGPVCHVNPFGAIQSPSELVHGCYLYEYRKGEQSALVALHRNQFSGGCRVHVQALQSLAPGRIQTRHLMAAIEAQAFDMGADVLTLATQHTGIAAAAGRWGAHISGVVVAKYLGVN